MSNSLYASAAQALLEGGLDLSTLELRVVLVDTTIYTPNLSVDGYLDTIDPTAQVAISDALTTVSTTAGALDADDVVLVAVTGAECSAFVLYASAATVGDTPYADAIAPLIGFYDTGSGLPLTPDGTDVTLSWPAGGAFEL